MSPARYDEPFSDDTDPLFIPYLEDLGETDPLAGGQTLFQRMSDSQFKMLAAPE